MNTVNQIIEPDQDTKIVDVKRYGLDELSKLNVDCVFQWSNEGIFSYYLNTPFCTRFGYAVYISKDAEIAVLEELRVKPPSLIIYDTPHPWSMSIYGRHMRDRLPNIDQWIKENYAFQTNAAGYVFAIPRRKIKEI